MDLTRRCIVSIMLSPPFFLSVSAQDWVKSFGHREGDAVITGLVTDTENNVIVTGTFSSEELELGEGQVLQSRGMEDVFIAKYISREGLPGSSHSAARNRIMLRILHWTAAAIFTLPAICQHCPSPWG